MKQYLLPIGIATGVALLVIGISKRDTIREMIGEAHSYLVATSSGTVVTSQAGDGVLYPSPTGILMQTTQGLYG